MTRWLVVLGFGLGLVGCSGAQGGTYCQSGSKYGTQCYSLADIQSPPGQPPPPPTPPGESVPSRR